MKNRKKMKQARRAVTITAAMGICAMCAITALASNGIALIEPFNAETAQDGLYAGEDARHITLRTEAEETVPAAAEESDEDSDSDGNLSAAATGTTLSASDQSMLLRIAMAEAEDQDTKGMALVMRVILNRVQSGEWPNSVEGVITQKGQFEPVSNGRYYSVTPDARCYEALNMVMSGWDESQGAEYFCMAGSSKWHERNLKRLFQYKDHVFYK